MDDKSTAPKIETENSGGDSQSDLATTKIGNQKKDQKNQDRPKTTSRRDRLVLPLILVCAMVGFGGGYLGSVAQSPNSQQTSTAAQRVVLQSQGDVIADIAKEVGQSVVSVNVTQTYTSNSFFGPYQSQQQAAGTGIILSSDGLVLTNRHVVPSGTTKVSVTLSDGTKFDDVEVVGRTGSSDSLDIAFLQIKDLKGKKLTAAKLGDSAAMKVGDGVVAIGNALGQFQNTVTSGIISGYGRNLTAGGDGSSENLENLFQTDAAINQGNSGGPLVNLAGEVIGVNVAVADGAQSIGFAIPINDVKGLVGSVEKNGKLVRPYIGVVYLSITADLATDYNLPLDQGAYLAPRGIIGQDPIIAGSPADKAGLKPGDIITKVGSQTVDQKHSITSIISTHQPGDKVDLEVMRSGKTITISLTLGSAPADDE